MSLKMGALAVLAAAVFVGTPTLAQGTSHGSTHSTAHAGATIYPTFCVDGDFDEFDAYSRINTSHGFIWQGGIGEEQGESAVGFEILANNIDNFSFAVKTAGSNEFFVVYGYDFDGSSFAFSETGVNYSTSPRTGVTTVTFKRRDSGLSRSDIISGIFLEDFGVDFDATAYNFSVNTHALTGRGPLTEECAPIFIP